jgi:hypothetical protein
MTTTKLINRAGDSFDVDMKEWETAIKFFQRIMKGDSCWKLATNTKRKAGFNYRALPTTSMQFVLKPFFDLNVPVLFVRFKGQVMLGFVGYSEHFRIVDLDGSLFNYDKFIDMKRFIDVSQFMLDKQEDNNYGVKNGQKPIELSKSMRIRSTNTAKLGAARKAAKSSSMQNKGNARVDKAAGRFVDEGFSGSRPMNERSEWLFLLYYELVLNFVNHVYAYRKGKIEARYVGINFADWDQDLYNFWRDQDKTHEFRLDCMYSIKGAMYWLDAKDCYDTVYKLWWSDMRVWLLEYIENGEFARFARRVFQEKEYVAGQMAMSKSQTKNGKWIVQELDRVFRVGNEKQVNFKDSVEGCLSVADGGLREFNESVEDTKKFIDETIAKGSWALAEKRKQNLLAILKKKNEKKG